jgi:hypothetical protein
MGSTTAKAKPEGLFLNLNDRYVLVAFEQVRLANDIAFPLVLTDRVRILTSLPVVPAKHWKEWLGTLLWKTIEERCNMFAIVSEPNPEPGVLNHKALRNEMVGLLHGLALTGWPQTSSVHMLCGNMNADGPDIRQHSEPVDFKFNDRLRGQTLNEARLREVFTLSEHLVNFYAGGKSRVKRGYRALHDALKADYIDDRLHLLVRALDAVVKTEQGQGRIQFGQRCSRTFLVPHADNEQALYDMYFLRNAVEHVKDIEGEPARLADEVQRKEVRERRQFQLEVLALAVYRRIVGDPILRAELGTDQGIDTFWALDDAVRAAKWNSALDLDAIQ